MRPASSAARRRQRKGTAAKIAGSSASPPGAPGPAVSPRRSAAALLALLAFAWGQSFLLLDWARRHVFEPDGTGHLVLVGPLFGGAAGFATVAILARSRGRASLGGTLVHHLGLASGLLGLTALGLLLHVGPRATELDHLGRQVKAARQLTQAVQALELHRSRHGSYPMAAGPNELARALSASTGVDIDPIDPWGQPLAYHVREEGAGYLLLSTGPDGVLDVPEWALGSFEWVDALRNDIAILTGVPVGSPARILLDARLLAGRPGEVR